MRSRVTLLASRDSATRAAYSSRASSNDTQRLGAGGLDLAREVRDRGAVQPQQVQLLLATHLRDSLGGEGRQLPCTAEGDRERVAEPGRLHVR